MTVMAACGPIEPTPTATPPPASTTSGPSGSPSPIPSNSPFLSASPAATVDAALACPITTAPGPGDEPPRGGGDLIDLTDYGAGRYRLCLADPRIGEFEHTAWCQWTEDRTLVRDYNGLPMQLGDVSYQGWFELGNGEFELSATDALGRVSTYLADAHELLREIGKDGRDGHVAFAVELYIDPEAGAHPGALPAITGAMSWTCGDPPPAG
jgi:hypothetical protein